MKKCRTEMVVAVTVLVATMLQLIHIAVAQEQQGQCWEKLESCVRNSTRATFGQNCCPIVVEEMIAEDTECFCSAKPRVLEDPTYAGQVSSLLSFCGAPAFETICPDSTSTPSGTPSAPPPSNPSMDVTPSASPPGSAPSTDATPNAPSPAQSDDGMECWNEIDTCIVDNMNNDGSDPRFDQTSPSFNATEFFCCPLIQQTALEEKQCFCGITNFLQQNPSQAEDTTQLLSTCGVADSIDSLDQFCEGDGAASSPSPSAVSSPGATPMMAPQGDESPKLAPTPATPTKEAEDTGLASPPVATPPTEDAEAEQNGANKMAMKGSLASLLILFTYILFD